MTITTLITFAIALGIAPAAHANSVTVTSSAGGASQVSAGFYRGTFNTTATSAEPCRNWSQAADAQVVPPDDERYQAAVSGWGRSLARVRLEGP